MSSVNNDLVVVDIVDRCKQYAGLGSDKELANLFGLSAGDFGNRKKRGTLLPLLLEWAVNENVDLNYIFLGRGTTVLEMDVTPKIFELLSAAKSILTSEDQAAYDILKETITKLDRTLSAEKRAQEAEEQVQILAETVRGMQQQMEGLMLENQRLDTEDEVPSSNKKVA